MQVVAQSQSKLKIEVDHQPLNVFLLELREKHQFQLVYDENLASNYFVSISGEFKNQEALISKALKGLKLEYKKSGEVFIIYPKSKNIAKNDTLHRHKIQGQVLEASTYEPLPYSNILVNNKIVESDQKGYFSYVASNDSSFSLKISHLGYYIYDTVITRDLNRTFFLHPSLKQLGEITVTNNIIEKSTHIGDKPGNITLNHNIAPFLPGYGDNSVFNLVRLMPGILAAGEQSSDLMIWGSYEGQSKISFDGFTVFGLKNYNDNIGVVNPLIIKNIDVYKGGYDASFGDRVGGIVNISGKDGNRKNAGLNLSINNSTINALLEVPILKKSTLTAAVRKTYYELYDPVKQNINRKRNDNSNGNENGTTNYSVDLNALPDYNFSDFNLKYSLSGNNGDLFYISYYYGGDDFNYELEGDVANTRIFRTETEENQQMGGSAFYSKNWGNGNSSNIIFAYSSLENNSFEENKTENLRNGKEKTQKFGTIDNQISESYIELKNRVVFPKGQNMELGFGYIENKSKLLSTSFESTVLNQDLVSKRFYGFVQDNVPLGKYFQFKGGMRATYSSDFNKLYIEPKISFALHIDETWKINAAWGIYNQYIAKVSQVDSVYNYSYFWTIPDRENIPVLHGEHFVGGLKYFKNDLTICLEGFYKTTTGLARFHRGNNRIERGFYDGEAQSKGLDFYIKKEYKNNLIWLAYTLSKTEERFTFQRIYEYSPALHDQRHELKIAGIVNIKSFYLSANYVFGSGFEKTRETLEEVETDIPVYKRLDASLVYRFTPKKFNMEAGLSILNILNYENLKFSNLSRVSTGALSSVNVYAEAVPFSPSLFLKLKF